MQNSERETLTLLLRRPTSADDVILRGLWRNEEVRYFLGGIVQEELIDEKIVSIQEHWDKYGFGQWAVFEKTSKVVIGICGLHHSEDGIEISYMFFPAFWGKGRGRESVFASLNYGFNVLKLDRIIAITQDANSPSCRLLDSIGMKHIDNLWRFNAVQRLYVMTLNEWMNNVKKRAKIFQIR